MLCRANLGILNQKLLLLEAMNSTWGATQAQQLFSSICPIVKASVGQHIRHAMDHIELAVQAAETRSLSEIHYDIRKRGGPDEAEIEQAQLRIEGVIDRLTSLSTNEERKE